MLKLIIKFDNDVLNEIDNYSISDTVICEPECCASFLKQPNCYLKILSQNIRSLNANFDGLNVLLQRLQFECDIIVLSECWMSCVRNLPVLDGYLSMSTSSHYNQNDGVVVFVKNNIRASLEEPIMEEANCLIIKVNGDVAVVAIYRPFCFKTINNFLTSLQKIINGLSSYKNIILVGDININIATDSSDRFLSDYLDFLSLNGLIPAFNTATRANSCLDHVILKTKLQVNTFIVESIITDHAPILCCAELKNVNNNSQKKEIVKLDFEAIRLACEHLDFTQIFEATNPNAAMDIFISKISYIMHINTKVLNVTNRFRILKPWMTVGLLRCTRVRDRMHKKLKQNPENVILEITFKRYRNFYNKIINKLKREYEKKLLRAAGNNNKSIWKAINNITNRNVKKDNSLDLLSLQSTPHLSVNAVNHFFSTIGENLSNKITPLAESSHFSKVVQCDSSLCGNSLVLLDTDEDEIESLIIGLKSNCAAGDDGITSDILKLIKNYVVAPLTFIFNMCLKMGVFPDSLKRSIVRPIFKGGDRSRVTNYRPISILTSLSKLFEKIINKRLTNYLEKFNLLSNQQFGFRSGKSTEDALNNFTEHLVKTIDNKKKCLTIFLDLAKAFDTVSIPTLVNKLHQLGIRGLQLKLLQDYLSRRTQIVKIGNYTSDSLPVTHGVPQGSILGPTMFLVYINDLTLLNIKNCKIITYADDTTLTFHGDTWREAFQKAQDGFGTVMKWLAHNYLSLNTDKTKYIAFQIRTTCKTLHLTHQITSHTCHTESGNCSCPTLSAVDSIKYLGLTFDKNLNFNKHVISVSNRIRKLIYVFKQIRHAANPDVVKMIYYSLCQSVITYCITCWGGAAKTYNLTAERAQRALLKVCCFKPRYYSTTELYRDCEVLTVRKLFVLALIMRQHSRIKLNALTERESTSRRRFNVFKSASCRTSFAQKFTMFLGPRMFNIANKQLQIVSMSKSECKQKVTNWLLNLTYDETEKLFNIPV